MSSYSSLGDKFKEYNFGILISSILGTSFKVKTSASTSELFKYKLFIFFNAVNIVKSTFGQLVKDNCSITGDPATSSTSNTLRFSKTNVFIASGNFNTLRLRNEVDNSRLSIAVPCILISCIKGELLSLNVPPKAVHPLKSTLVKYLFADKFALFEFISDNIVAFLHSSSIKRSALPISIESGFIELKPLIRLILLPPYINTSWSVAA